MLHSMLGEGWTTAPDRAPGGGVSLVQLLPENYTKPALATVGFTIHIILPTTGKESNEG